MKEKNWIKNRIAELKKSENYEKEQIKMHIAEEISKRLDELGLNKKGFANLMGKSPAYITKLLNGTNNFTIDTLFDIGKKLNLEFNAGYNLEKDENFIVIGIDAIAKNYKYEKDSDSFAESIQTMTAQYRVSQNQTIPITTNG